MKGRVAIAMSGGVDSSVAAALLIEDGYDVIGLTMKLFTVETSDIDQSSDRGCCSIDSIHRAEAVCQRLGIPHYSIDLTEEFRIKVIEDFTSEYFHGRTPNPCVRCNTHLKWGSLFSKARMLDCDYIATGHYARIIKEGDEYILSRSTNREKDQAYALWGIPRDFLGKTIFPLGELRKDQVRKIASDMGLKTAQTPESQEICFIPKNDYPEFLKGYKPELYDGITNGTLYEETDDGLRAVGTHGGYPYYTIGQRKGLGGGFPTPRYVVEIDAADNRVVIGDKDRLYSLEFIVDQVNWLFDKFDDQIEADVQVRYRSGAHPAIIESNSADKETVRVRFKNPVDAITPGQSAVFFQGERLIGGGCIEEVIKAENNQ